ncbi:MAG: peptidoglycan-associated lipoprotein Pal [Candidatus Eiseniibacteriota bacterium]|nr:MAG: peptidoglycan-associated lipoprotein Pal [Candidatus Eisenbacteria bacterium]
MLFSVLALLLVALLFSFGCAKKKVTPTKELPTPPVRTPAEEVTEPVVQPEELLEPVQEEPIEERVAAQIQDVFFAFDDYSLTEEGRNTLAQNAKVLADNPTVKVVIEGHCDERGTVEYNLALGEKRAMSVKNYLVNYGLDPARTSIISYGKERPFDPGHSEQAWAKNRRAHFVIRK